MAARAPQSDSRRPPRHGAPGPGRAAVRNGKDWASLQSELAITREKLRDAESLASTRKVVVERHNETLRQIEAENATLKGTITALEAGIEHLKSSPVVVPRERERLPETRRSETWTIRIGDKENGTSCTVCLGFYDSGALGEVFLRFDKKERGSHGASMADLACQYLSILLQYGVPLEELLDKMIGATDESGGMTRVRVVGDDGAEQWTADPDVTIARSLRDYLGKRLRARFCNPQQNSTGGA